MKGVPGIKSSWVLFPEASLWKVTFHPEVACGTGLNKKRNKPVTYCKTVL